MLFFLRHQLSTGNGLRRSWKRYAKDTLFAAMVAAVLTVPIMLLQSLVNASAMLLFYLAVVVVVAYWRSFRFAVLTAFLTCFICDYFLVSPSDSLLINDPKAGLDLLAYLFCAIVLSFLASRLRDHTVKIKQQKDEEQVRYSVEVSRQAQQMSAYWAVMQQIREEKELQKQLELLAHTIEELFACCGVRKCTFFGPDIDGQQFLHRWNEDSGPFAGLSTLEEDSAAWVLKHGQSVEVRETPMIAREMGSYLRRVVASNGTKKASQRRDALCSYLVPLLSGQKVLGESGQKVVGVMRLLIEDSDHPDAQVIKKRLGIGCASSEEQENLFSQLLGHATNLVEQALIERALMEHESQNQELQRRSDALRSTIISSVSHDFHTPLNFIKGVATGLQVRDVQSIEAAEHSQMMELVVNEVDWLERMVMKMLDLSRIEQGALKIEKELYPIDGIILTTLDRAHMRSLLAGRRVDRHVPDELTPVEVDPLLIEHVLVNLLENAVRYTPEQSPIAIGVREVEGWLIVSVTDSGPGIPKLELERIFESFYRVKSRGAGDEPAAPGSGLGLAVCRGFVEAHGGSIWAENRTGGGAVMQFTLPL